MAESTIDCYGVREKYCSLADKPWLISQIRPSEQANVFFFFKMKRTGILFGCMIIPLILWKHRNRVVFQKLLPSLNRLTMACREFPISSACLLPRSKKTSSNMLHMRCYTINHLLKQVMSIMFMC